MASSIAENANRDMYIGTDGNLAFNKDLTATAQLCKSRIESQRGEMQYAYNQGMPTRLVVWDKFNPSQFEAAARRIMLKTANVASVPSFVIRLENGTLTYQAQIATTFGNGVING